MSVTYGQHDNYTDIYDGKMANFCQNVRGNKPNQNNNKTKSKTKLTKEKKRKKEKKPEGQGYKANS